MEERFETFTVLIAKINRCIKKIKTEEMNQMNLKSPHVSGLYYLFKSEKLTAKELGDMCGEDKAALSRSLEYLEKNGYITCEDNGKKRYRSTLTLSTKGKNVAKIIADKIDGILDVSSLGLTEEKRSIMYEGLTIIYNNLTKLCNKYEEKNND